MPRLKVAVGGSVCKLSGPRRVAGRSVTWRRGKIVGFSAGSRRRFQEKLQSVNQDAAGLPLFITLTYPNEWPESGRKWHRDREAWWKRVRRRWPGASMFWRLEFQKRGAPHFHVLLFGVPFLPLAWLARSWYEVVGSGDEKHLAAGTQVQRVKSWRGVASYASKYMAKVGGGSPLAEDVGRYWGVMGEENLPIEFVDVLVEFPQFFRLRRVLRRYLEHRGVCYPDRSEWQGRLCFLPWSVGARLVAGLAK